MEKPCERAPFASKANTQWLRRILFPFWICRILLLVVMSVAQIATVYWVSQEVDLQGLVLASLIVVVLFTVLCISMDAVSLILLGRDSLMLKVFLSVQSVEALLWTALVGVQIAAGLETSNKNLIFLTWLISAIL